MKKKSFQKRSSSFLASGLSTRSIIIICVLVLILLIRIIFPSFFSFLTSPLFGIGTSLTSGVKGMTSGFQNAITLQAQIDALTKENTALVNENRALKTEIADTDEFEEVSVAGVIARPPLAPSDTVLVSRKSIGRVEENMLVVAEGGVPIGTVGGANNNSIQVLLFSMRGRELEAWVGEDREAIRLVGQGSGAFVSTVSKDFAVAVGDEVYIPGPGARPIGTVSEIVVDPSSPTSLLRINPYVNIFSLTQVGITSTILP